MQLLSILGFVFGLALATGHHVVSPGSPCADLSGVWRNQLGSNMTIQRVLDSNKFSGQYNTSVESSKGAATFSSNISGMFQNVSGGSLVAFNVLWNHGASLTSWVGQCMVCDGHEKIFTTWVLRSLMPARKRWMTTRINQDTFWRVDDSVEHGSGVSSDDNNGSTELVGTWVSVTGDSFKVTRTGLSNSLEGTHEDAGSNKLFPIYGNFDGNQTYTALGLVSSTPDNIQGWAGHISNSQDVNQKLETSWLSQGFSDNCNNPRKHVKYGMEDYVKQETIVPQAA